MKINIPIKQQTQFGCLAACYSMIKNYLFGETSYDVATETQLTSEAFSVKTGFNEHYYLKKMSDWGCEVRVFLETPYMFDEYSKVNSELGGNISVEHRLIGIEDYKKLINDGYLIISVIDLWHIDMIIHFAHYVIINGFTDNHISIIDPKYGREIMFSNRRFQDTLDNIKYRLKHSPLLFAIKKANPITSAFPQTAS